MTTQNNVNQMKGLTNEEVKKAQEKYGKNQLIPEKKENFFLKIISVLKEPMFLLLIISSIIYFILGEPRDGIIMLVFVTAMIGIDVIQEWKTDKTLNALKNLSAPRIKVIRNGNEVTINSEDLVPGDLMLINEGDKIPADGKILKLNDLCVDESSMTGEAEGVWKTLDINEEKNYWKKNYCYAGTLVIQGSGIVRVEKIGSETEYGKIGINISEAPNDSSPLQKQTRNLIKVSAIIAGILFLLVCIITYFNLSDHFIKDRIIESILAGITLAMAMIPEEFPVILTVFLSMGAWRLAKKQSLVRKLSSIETLGAISVLCVDKTGTITMNKMTVNDLWALKGDSKEMIKIMGMACETNPYDPMEKAMISYCEDMNYTKEKIFSGELLAEYPFTNENKMMGHVWKNKDDIILAAKGSPEMILTISNLTEEEKIIIENKIYEMSSKGLRTIAIAKKKIDKYKNIKDTINECCVEFLGLVALQDPPRESVKADIKTCIDAGIKVIMITGDNGITASSIAKQVGIPNNNKIITGDEINSMSDDELGRKVGEVSIFSRVIPEHKMRIVKALKGNGEIVAMTGDGVNDAPALKYADIGIAMGKRGSEVSKEAADLILLDDNFSTIVHTIEDGRRIYDNIKKAIGYVFTIHIPIAFASLLGPLMGITSSSLLLLPIHVVLLELIIDPTCSIVLERQPAEEDIMRRKPRKSNDGILSLSILSKSIIQGIILFLASFGMYYMHISKYPMEADVARSMGLMVIMLSNILLVQVNSSDVEFVYKSMMKLRKDPVMWGITIGTLLGIVVILYTPLSKFLALAALNIRQVIIVIFVSIISVLWYELVKFFKKNK